MLKLEFNNDVRTILSTYASWNLCFITYRPIAISNTFLHCEYSLIFGEKKLGKAEKNLSLGEDIGKMCLYVTCKNVDGD